MKREDMVSIIGDFSKDLIEGNSYSFADGLLSLLEAEGMLPPLSSTCFDIKCKTTGESIGTSGLFGYEWEPEESFSDN